MFGCTVVPATNNCPPLYLLHCLSKRREVVLELTMVHASWGVIPPPMVVSHPPLWLVPRHPLWRMAMVAAKYLGLLGQISHSVLAAGSYQLSRFLIEHAGLYAFWREKTFQQLSSLRLVSKQADSNFPDTTAFLLPFTISKETPKRFPSSLKIQIFSKFFKCSQIGWNCMELLLWHILGHSRHGWVDTLKISLFPTEMVRKSNGELRGPHCIPMPPWIILPKPLIGRSGGSLSHQGELKRPRRCWD